MNIDKLIEDFNNSASSKPDIFGDRIFTDEPLLFRASHMEPSEPAEPPEYKAMRQLSNGKNRDMITEAEVFYRQAKLMEDFTDDHEYCEPFYRYFVTYRQLTSSQLRGYFTFRAKIRKGEHPVCPEQYVFLLLSELFMLIGAADKFNAFQKINDILSYYESFFPKLKSYKQGWLRDFAVFYDLPPEYALTDEMYRFDKALSSLIHCQTESDEELFQSICLLSDFNHAELPPEQKRQKEYIGVFCRCFRELSRYYDTKRKVSLSESLFGKISEFPVSLFPAVVFYDWIKYESYTYEITPIFRYQCKNGRWTLYRSLSHTRKNYKLNALSRDIFSVISELLDEKKAMPSIFLSATCEKRVRKTVEEYMKEKREREARTVTIDLTVLDSIRRLSEITQNKLLTAEETGDDLPEPVNTRQNNKPPALSCAADEKTEPTTVLLTPEELNFTRLLLNLQPKKALEYIKTALIPLTVICDSVNEKLFDTFCDTVILCENEEPFILEDYREELKGMLKL